MAHHHITVKAYRAPPAPVEWAKGLVSGAFGRSRGYLRRSWHHLRAVGVGMAGLTGAAFQSMDQPAREAAALVLAWIGLSAVAVIMGVGALMAMMGIIRVAHAAGLSLTSWGL